MTPTDRADLERWTTRGDADAFHSVVLRYAGMVYATCRRILGNDADAEEITQECFEILAADGARSDVRVLGAWLHGIATKRSLQRIRKDKRRLEREQRYASENLVNRSPQWEDIYDCVDEAVAALPDALRVPLIARFYENQTHAEIASALGIARTTVIHRIQKALRVVGEALTKRGAVLPIAVLAAVLEANLARAAPLPATLNTSLGKLAVARAATRKTALLPHSLAKAATGVLSMKLKVGAVTALVAILLALGWTFRNVHPNQSATHAIKKPPTQEAPKLIAAQRVPTRPPAPVAPESPALRLAATAPANTPAHASSNRSASQPASSAGPAKDHPQPAPPVRVSGRIVDEKGDGIGGAQVSLVPQLSFDRPLPGDASILGAITDPTGNYTFDHVQRRDSELVFAVANGYQTGRKKLSLAHGNVKNADITLKSGNILMGRVLTATRDPVAGAVVSATAVMTANSGRSASNRFVAVTDSQGDFTLGFKGPCMVSLVVFSKQGSATFLNVPTEPDQVTKLTLPAMASLHGRVTRADGSSVQGLTVTLSGSVTQQSENGSSSVGMPISKLSAPLDANGNYRIDGLDPGQKYSAGIRNGAGKALLSGQELAMFAPGEQREQDFVISASIHVTGHVYIENTTRPAQRCQVYSLSTGQVANVGADGSYSFQLTNGPGTYRFIAKYGTGTAIYMSSNDTPQIVELALEDGDSKELDLYLPAAAIVNFKVVNGAGAPVPKACVMVYTEPYSGSTKEQYLGDISDSQGRLKPASVPAGRPAWAVAMPAAPSTQSGVIGGATAVFTLDEGQTYDETIVMRPQGGVTGVAVTGSGQAIANSLVVVAAQRSDGRITHSTGNTDANGQFTVNGAFSGSDVRLVLTLIDRNGSVQTNYAATAGPISLPQGAIQDLGTLTFVPGNGHEWRNAFTKGK